ncbi:hypothetical protein N752_14500 [Desulforamulus aquiferis]|nr:hypothetical protein N752_14500 [Desulforamulus aquiferis]
MKEQLFEGVLIRAYGGFYYVKKGEEVWECSLRGKFRLEKTLQLPGG